MRRLLAICLLVWSGGAATAQDGPQAAVRAVISAQIEALKVDDFERAFSFASPGIREMFGTSERFCQMVREGYPMVWRPGEVRFSDLDRRDGRTLQRMLVTDGAGALYVLEYEMVRGEDGWRIDGVRILDDEGVEA
jgi:Domain of unknown function (DUF4864)